MTTNDTRTARERAEDAGRLMFPYFTHGVTNRLTAQLQGAYQEGVLARDAEPTTVTAEQIEKAAQAMYEGSTGFKLTRGKPWSELSESTRETQLEYVRIAFRAAGFRIEGDEA